MLVGLVIAFWQVGLLRSKMPSSIARYIANWNTLSLDWPAVFFTAGAAILCGIVSGLLPALRASRPDLNSTLKEGGRGSSQGQSHHRLKNILLIGEVALSLVLLVGAGLMVRGVGSLRGDTDSYQPDGVLTLMLTLPDSRYKDAATTIRLYDGVLSGVAELPNARDVSIAATLPYSNINNSRIFTVEGQVRQRGGAGSALIQSVSPSFLSLMHIPLHEGRFVREADDQNAPKVAVISESVARRYWPGQDPIGRHLKFGGPDAQEPWLTVAGVVGDVRYNWYDRGVPFAIYVPYAQNPQPFTFLALRTTNPDRLIPSVRAKIGKVDAELPISNAKSFSDLIRDSLIGLSYMAVMMTVLGAMALALACVGVYGVMAYSVTERTREIGIRMALGAGGRNVVGMILRRGLAVTGIGLLIGLVCSAALARLVASLIWGVNALDLTTFAGVSAVLIGVALLASYVPARRASRVDPLISLRCE